MEDHEIASLTPGCRAFPIKIRAVRRWNPAFRSNETCFILVDKKDDGVQAIAKGSEQRVVEARLRVGSCYLMKNYGCGVLENYSNTLSHPTNLVIGGATQFAPIPETGEIPRYYFNFASRQRMEAACDKDEVIDYIGILIDIEDKMTNDNRPYLLLTIKDCSIEYVKVTLWQEIATSLERYNRPAIEAAVDPKIIGMTAMKVKKYNRKEKLQSTAATYVYMDPTSAETHKLLEIYDNPPIPNPSINQAKHLLNTGSESVTTVEVQRASGAHAHSGQGYMKHH